MINSLPPEILKLSINDRISLADLIYESVDDDLILDEDLKDVEEPDSLEMLPNQRAELERRMDEYEKNPERVIPIEQVFGKRSPPIKPSIAKVQFFQRGS